MRIEFFLASESRTYALGAALSRLIRVGDILALRGDLGAGKTSLARGLIQTLVSEAEEVPSPTFTLLQTYQARGFTIFHFDLYRIENADEIFELGWDDMIDGVSLIEWPERAGPHLPDQRLDITLIPDENGRIAALEPKTEDWQRRLDGFRI